MRRRSVALLTWFLISSLDGGAGSRYGAIEGEHLLLQKGSTLSQVELTAMNPAIWAPTPSPAGSSPTPTPSLAPLAASSVLLEEASEKAARAEASEGGTGPPRRRVNVPRRRISSPDPRRRISSPDPRRRISDPRRRVSDPRRRYGSPTRRRYGSPTRRRYGSRGGGTVVINGGGGDGRRRVWDGRRRGSVYINERHGGGGSLLGAVVTLLTIFCIFACLLSCICMGGLSSSDGHSEAMIERRQGPPDWIPGKPNVEGGVVDAFCAALTDEYVNTRSNAVGEFWESAEGEQVRKQGVEGTFTEVEDRVRNFSDKTPAIQDLRDAWR